MMQLIVILFILLLVAIITCLFAIAYKLLKRK